MAQALTAGIDQEHNGPLGMIAYHLEHRSRHRERELDADFGVVGGADHRDRVLAAAALTRQQIAFLAHLVAGREHLLDDFFPFHVKTPSINP